MSPWRVAGSIAGLSLVMLAACVDTSPIDYVAPDSGASAEGGSGADAGLVAACRECITQGACESSYKGCIANEKCETEVNCMLDAYCFNWSIEDTADLPACVTSCAIEAGVTGQSDPEVSYFVPLLFCAQDMGSCGAVCNVGTP
jgi:hypothetical protein